MTMLIYRSGMLNLCGNNVRLIELFRQEFDREESALLEGNGHGLGLMGDYDGVGNWYGGRIQQIARLYKSTTGYDLRIEKPEKTRSYEIARRHSSRRIMQVRISKDL